MRKTEIKRWIASVGGALAAIEFVVFLAWLILLAYVFHEKLM